MRIVFLYVTIVLAAPLFAGENVLRLCSPANPLDMALVAPSSFPTSFVELHPESAKTLRSLDNASLAGFSLPGGEEVTLRVEQFTVFDRSTVFIEQTATGPRPLKRPEIWFFRGTVEGKENSYVYFSLTENTITGYIEAGGERYLLMPVEGVREGLVAMYPDYERKLEEKTFTCMTDDIYEGDISGNPQIVEVERQPLRAKIAIDADYETYQKFDNSASIAAKYITDLFGAAAAIYRRDINVELRISFLRIWSTSADPYTQTSLQPALLEFQNY